MLHVLVHLHQLQQAVTSDQLALMLHTNPVVVRRTMSLLREQGYVSAVKGHGGGWRLIADLESITLLNIHNAVGGPRIFAIGNEHDNPQCAVERVVNAALEDALGEAEALLINRLGTVTLAELARGFDLLCKDGEESFAEG